MRRAALGLRARLLLLVLVAVVPGFGLLVYSAAAQRQMLGREAERGVVRTASLAAEQQQRAVHEIRGTLAGLVQHPTLLRRDPAACGRVTAALRVRWAGRGRDERMARPLQKRWLEIRASDMSWQVGQVTTSTRYTHGA